MYCRFCGKPVQDSAAFCPQCGKPLSTPPRRKKPRGILLAVLAVVIVAAAAVGGFFFFGGGQQAETPSVSLDQSRTDVTPPPETSETGATAEEPPASSDAALPAVEPQARKSFLNFSVGEGAAITPAVTAYQVAPDLSNLINPKDFAFLSDAEKALLAENLFVVHKTYNDEFYELYESNRYNLTPNFITVDSMMHTYHLYFSLLLSRTEKDHLAQPLLALSQTMRATSQAQYDALRGTAWEEAARTNLAFFAVAEALQDPSAAPPAAVAELVQQELSYIHAASAIETSPLLQSDMDYSQFKPRGYYEGDSVLEAYFRAMMWYGQVNFAQNAERLNRSALLMTLALRETALPTWEMLYTVTAFFAGASDDLGYYEYAPAIEAAYGAMPTLEDLTANEAAYETFAAQVAQMDPPAINSVPVMEGTENIPEVTKGFRLMGQRFTLDAAVMQQLVYSNVKENAAGEKRMLPDVLDLPAALGSDLALSLLEQQGAAGYAGYSEAMEKLRGVVSQAPASAWAGSLYSSWLYTLSPLLEPKGEGYPSFMTTTAWQTHNLETYAGSFTELKHDTVLYAKQVMAEMGGGPMEEVDDRGYVEPEVEVYRRFALLARQTAEGLESYGLISDGDLENLSRLAELAQRLEAISEKELREETLTDEEYELIRAYGGTLEHFWIEAVEDKTQSPYLDPQEIPASLVTDIATDPNGRVLQIANGRPAEILVVVPVDGTLRVASGVVYDFYQFEQPLSQRLTDTTWRQLIGEWITEDGSYNWDAQVEKPWWTTGYWYLQ